MGRAGGRALGGTHIARRGPRRASTTIGSLAVALLGVVLPGAGLLWCRRRVGLLLLLPWLGAIAVLALRFQDLHELVSLAVDPGRLRLAAGAVAATTVVIAASVVVTYVLARPVEQRRGGAWLGMIATYGLCVAVAVPGFVASRYALIQADLVRAVFQNNVTATAPRNVTAENPWGKRRHVSVLLLGGDGGIGRIGVRTDSMILLRMDTRTGDTVMFSLPRNMMNAQFPDDSPLHDLYPEGFRGDGDPGSWMLNAVYGQVPALHPGILGESDNEGADAIKQAVAGSLGIPVDYYLLVNLRGFQTIVDAMGGVTVNVNQRVAIGGNSTQGIPPDAWLEPGPAQHLDGFHALWFSRGRYGADDYQRMLRQRCMVNALIDEANPVTLVRRYEALAAAGKEIVRTDVPAELLPAFVDLGVRIKDAGGLRSIAFVSSPSFFPGDPDFDWLQDAVLRALVPKASPGRAGTKPPRTGSGSPSPSPTPTPSDAPLPDDPVEVADSCEYAPTE